MMNGEMEDELKRLREELAASKRTIADQARENGAIRATLANQRVENGSITKKLSENAKWNGKMTYKKLVAKHGDAVGLKFASMSHTIRVFVWPRMKIMVWNWKDYTEESDSVCQVSMRTLRWAPSESRQEFWEMLGVSICIYVLRSLRDQASKDVKNGVRCKLPVLLLWSTEVRCSLFCFVGRFVQDEDPAPESEPRECHCG